jgi:hypothetical protein
MSRVATGGPRPVDGATGAGLAVKDRNRFVMPRASAA